MKQIKALEVGIGGQIHHLPQSASTTEVLSLINTLNKSDTVTGFFVQLPLPSQIDKQAVINAIDPGKDVDGLTATNLGLLYQRHPSAIAPATPLGIIKLLEEYKIDLSGKNAVIIGRSSIVGLPLLAMLMARNATVTLCHTQTQNLAEICSQADILISSIGQPHFITTEYVKEGSIVIDVGTSYIDGKLSGDVYFNSVREKISYITPVPGGVGPMTIAMLLNNVVDIARKNLNS